MSEFLHCGRQEVCGPCLPLDAEQRLSVCFIVRSLTEEGSCIILLETREETYERTQALLEIAEGEHFTPQLVTAAVESAEELIF